ncbi:tRNA dimethylallyltransferase [Pedobacter steynii]|uniref:tRNA dimethylallyltransferase n=1 Tax=Pedobacter steynii TaxID=430522 RepID=A0A1G9KNY9_9SPHI|nr:tRNA (adenosine(37)-N6)-dimethylallyltransferase MiaA [Pedobacter steynii]NQX38602.1 tRNA (adenosine(37)-N6)-dimethylallyltransferase MiaA [Pedobacter steynii]SDL51173.1 tRNA dimethylallyltransferase [Pedobacter steynii]
MDQEYPLLVVLGPTASGKTKLAVRLAEALQGELISADSRQVFKDMDIGTGKDLKEYELNGQQIPYHLINIREAGGKYNVNEFKEDFYRVFEDLSSREVLPILCGGTGMYMHSVFQDHEYTAIPVNEPLRVALRLKEIEGLRIILKSYPLELTQHADLSSFKRLIRAIEIAEYLSHHELIAVKRPLIKPFVVGLTSDVRLRRKKILRRMEARLEEGMIEEVKGLLEKGVDPEVLTFYGLEYKFIVAYLSGTLDYGELKLQLGIAICQFAKRQMTFFRKMEKDGVAIHWFDTDQDSDQLFKQVMEAYIRWKTS